MRMSRDSLVQIDDLFARLLINPNDRSALDQMSVILSRELGLQFHIGIENTDKDIYLMRVEPSKSTLQRIVEASMVRRDYNMVKVVWEKEKEWFITIQSQILTGKFFPVTNRELTALLLHELGHVIYTNSIVNSDNLVSIFYL